MRSAWVLLMLAGCGRTGFEALDARPDSTIDARAPRPPLVWQPQTSNTVNRFYDVWGTGADNIYAVGDGGTIDHWNGTTWTVETTPNATSLYGINGSSPADIRAVGNDAGAGMAIWHPNGDGTWSHEPNTLTQVLNSPAVTTATDMYVAGYSGQLVHSTGDGVWTAQTTNTTIALEAMWASGPNDIYATGYNGTILHSTGDGTWTPQPTGTVVPLIAIDGADAQNVWAAGYSGKVLHSHGDGVWMAEDSGVSFDLYGITVIDDFVLASGVGDVIVTKDGDGPWTTQQLPVSQPFFDTAWAVSPDDVIIIGAGGTILRGTR